ncbi:IS3 family transposase [Domibacillus aminovorans]|uniref:Integrase catalytic domain-containing protein n=1 Tax=Domibacillus aminovorans TaxID=29332 RepID=A0A177L355_9BACI|nr:hypothetical protein AWH49_03325 [Domibacillus aminovorans]
MPFIESFHSSLKSEGFYTLKRESLLYFKVVQLINQYIHYYNQIRIQENGSDAKHLLKTEELFTIPLFSISKTLNNKKGRDMMNRLSSFYF